MVQPRFFQHLNENDDNFQKVTTLEYIDNSDGMNLYYFKDGTKCNKQFIAPVNANSIEGYEFAEVSSPHNIWKLNYVEPTIEPTKTAVNAHGEVVEVPTWEEFTQSSTIRKPRIDVIGRPNKINGYVAPNDDDYSIKTYMEAQKDEVKTEKPFDFNNSAPISTIKKETTKNINTNPTSSKTNNEHIKINNDELHIDACALMNKLKKVIIHLNNQVTELTIDEFFENALTPQEEKVVEKVVEKEVIVKTSDTDIDLGIDNVQKSLLDNMIDMSNKMDCTIDMELTLKLPPTNVYKLIKSVYPEGMDKGFVNILANRMQIKELKTAVADGLLAFYDEDIEDIEPKVEELSKPMKKISTKKNVEK